MSHSFEAAKRYREQAAKLSELAKEAPNNSYFRTYYKHVAQRYLTHADNEEKIATVPKRSAEESPLSESPSVQAAPEHSVTEDASAISASLAPSALEQELTSERPQNTRRHLTRAKRRSSTSERTQV
jgi:hypothetical protein